MLTGHRYGFPVDLHMFQMEVYLDVTDTHMAFGVRMSRGRRIAPSRHKVLFLSLQSKAFT